MILSKWKPNLLFLASVLGLSLAFGSCQKKFEPDCDATATPTYDGQVATIANASCAISGCHADGSRAGVPDLSDYAAMKAQADNGAIRANVVDELLMPPPSSGVSQLTEAERSTIACWLEGGAPEN